MVVGDAGDHLSKSWRPPPCSWARRPRRRRRCPPRSAARRAGPPRPLATRGSAIRARYAGAWPCPSAPRASSIEMVDAEFAEGLDEGAHRGQRSVVDHGAGPVEDHGLDAGSCLGPLRLSAVELGHHLFADGEGGAGARAAGDEDDAQRVSTAGRPASAGPAPRRRCRSNVRRARGAARRRRAAYSSRMRSSTPVGAKGSGVVP